jgi:hypothetical protein
VALRAYNNPGVTVTESVNPAIAPILANPQLVALVGPARGYATASERLVLTGTTAQTLRYTGVSTGSVTAVNGITGIAINPGAYVITQSSDPDATVTGDEIYTVARFLAPTAAPTAASGGTGTLVGTYVYAYSFVNASGETGISPASNAAVLATGGANLTAVAVGPTGTTARNVYRMKTSTGGDNKWHLVATIAGNSTTTLSNESTIDSVAQGDGVTTFGTQQAVQGIADGDTIVLTYQYTDQNYYKATIFDDYDDIVDRYGAPFDSNGNINSALSFAARYVFLNGASELVVSAARTSAQTDIDAGLATLESEPNVRIVVTTGGTAANAASVASHVVKMNGQGYYRIGIVGYDGSATATTAAVLRSAASGLNNEAVRLVNASSFAITNPVTGRPSNIGGQYAAAAVAGMYAGRDVQIPLTRKTVAGFDAVNDFRTASDLALDSSSGLLVIENRGGILRIRHDLTTAVGSVNTRESSVVRAKYEMAGRLKDTLDASVVGVVVPQSRAPLMVQGVVVGVLEQLLLEAVINGYSDVKGRLLVDPTTVEVRFQYTPAYPINNIVVVFTINTQTGDTDFQLTAT